MSTTWTRLGTCTSCTSTPASAGWVDNDLTQFAAGPAATGRALDGYWGKDDSQHVNYLDSNGHVHELYIHP